MPEDKLITLKLPTSAVRTIIDALHSCGGDPRENDERGKELHTLAEEIETMRDDAHDWNFGEVERWMREEMATEGAQAYGDNATKLAEAACAAFDYAHEGGPLDDPDHWVWELAIKLCPPQ